MSLSVTRRVGSVVAVIVLLSVLMGPAVVGASSTVHIVQPGDTLYRISLRYGVSMSSLASANGITNYNTIYVGQRLVIPGSETPPPTGGVHIVRAGESLGSIAQAYGVGLYALAQANGITNMNFIYPGQRLVIPGGATPPPSQPPSFYTVRYGDTLAVIAARYGTTVWSLMQLNGLANANRIYAGQVLRITGAAKPPTPPQPPQPPQPVGSWTAQYYNTKDLSGAVVLQRNDANLNFNWGFGSPAPQVFPDNFSARWTRSFNLSGGTYRVTARVDDGVRVFIDGVKVIDAWVVQPATTYVQDVIIPTGTHTFTVEYYEAEGVAEINVSSQKL